jgi:predicted thioesterase
MSRRPSDPPVSVAEGLVAGLAGRVTLVVGEEDTALALRSGDVAVLATPRLIALAEQASCLALDGHLPPGRTSVATMVQFDHLAPVALGQAVTADATLIRVGGRRLTFTITANLRADGDGGIVGAGRLTRVLVDRSTFLERAGAAGA